MFVVSAAPEVLSWPEEKEESDTYQVADGTLEVCSALAGIIEGLEDGYGDRADSCRRRVLIRVCFKFSSQAKVKLAQLVVLGVAGPRSCKYLLG